MRWSLSAWFLPSVIPNLEIQTLTKNNHRGETGRFIQGSVRGGTNSIFSSFLDCFCWSPDSNHLLLPVERRMRSGVS